MVTGGNRETNLVAMVAVKANSVELLFDRHTHEKLKMLISPVSDFKEMISRKKWVFTMATPYILKIIEILFK